MMSITCPALCGVATNLRGETFEWGLVEYIQDYLLPMALTAPELCDFLLRVSPMLAPLRGDKQVGAKLEFSDDDWGTLKRLAQHVRPPPDPLGLVTVATCNRAIFLAEKVAAVAT